MRWRGVQPFAAQSRFRPEEGCSNPAMRRNSVVLPEPLSPSNVRNSPAAISSERLFNDFRRAKIGLLTPRTPSSVLSATTVSYAARWRRKVTARSSPRSRFRCTIGRRAAHPAKNNSLHVAVGDRSRCRVFPFPPGVRNCAVPGLAGVVVRHVRSPAFAFALHQYTPGCLREFLGAHSQR